MAAMVAMERHIWVKVANTKEKEVNVLLEAPVSPSELFCTSVETVVRKFREVEGVVCSLQNLAYIPHRSRSTPQASRGPGPYCRQ